MKTEKTKLIGVNLIVPKWGKWYAVCENGFSFVFSHKPKKKDGWWLIDREKGQRVRFVGATTSEGWENSLQKIEVAE